MAKQKGDGTSGWQPCGCHIEVGPRIVYCQWHANVQKYMGMLDGIRRYFLETPADQGGGEESPFVKKIDELVPRKP